MFTLLAFLIVILGGINWLLIGMLQYDFVAGWFGYQGSIFSRLLYILVGIATFFLIFKAFKDKGSIKLVNFSKKKKEKEPAYSAKNIEASKDFAENSSTNNFSQNSHMISGKDYSERQFVDNSNFEENKKPQTNNIFDELD